MNREKALNGIWKKAWLGMGGNVGDVIGTLEHVYETSNGAPEPLISTYWHLKILINIILRL